MGRHGTIAGRKAAQDSKRAAVFTKYAKVITIAAKNGGDPEYNASLKMAIEKAKSINMPNDNIKRAIQKGTGELAGVTYEELNFEGYGASGVAVIVEALTDNKNRTTAAVRSTFDKFGGNLGAPGCVSYMFAKKGVIIIEKTDDLTEDKVMEDALNAGMDDDLITYDDSFEVLTSPEAFTDVYQGLKDAGYEFVSAEVEYVPSVEATPTNESDIKMLKKMIGMLEDNDDIQNVYHNCTIDLEEE